MSGANNSVPDPGVGSLVSLNGYEGTSQILSRPDVPTEAVSMAGSTKRASQSNIPEHLRDTDDRGYAGLAIAAFPSMPFGVYTRPGEALGYVVQIPLNKKAISKSVVQNGVLPEEIYNRQAHYYKEADRPNPMRRLEHTATGSDLEIADEDFEPREKFASAVDEINPLPPYDPAGERQMTKRLNEPMTWDTQQAKMAPGIVQKRIEKNTYDTIKKTKLPWEQFKKASWVNEKIEKYAGHFKLATNDLSNPNLWSLTDVNPLILDLILVGNFGKEWIDWEPETLKEALVRLGANPSQEVWDKVQALKTIHSGNWFWEDEGIFEKVCLALNGIEPNFEERQNLNIPPMSKAVSLAAKIRVAPFSEEVAAHVAAKAHIEGFIVLPSNLTFAEIVLNTMIPGLETIAAKVKQAYLGRVPAAGTDDVINVQLRKLYATETYVNLV